MQIHDEKKNFNYEGNASYGLVINDEDNIKFIADVESAGDLVGLSIGFLSGVLKCLRDSGVSEEFSRKIIEKIVSSVFENYDMINNYTEVIEKVEEAVGEFEDGTI